MHYALLSCLIVEYDCNILKFDIIMLVSHWYVCTSPDVRVAKAEFLCADYGWPRPSGICLSSW